MTRWLRKGCFAVALLMIWVFSYSGVQAEENRRYRAIPHGGSVFILDSRDGHLWLWQGNGGAVSKDGVNSQLVYQGNVRKNMLPDRTRSGTADSSVEVAPLTR